MMYKTSLYLVLFCLGLSSCSPPPTLMKRQSYQPPSFNGYTYLGCYSEAYLDKSVPNQHSLSDTGRSNQKMTPQYCMQSCSGYSFFGVENGNACYCGNEIRSGTALLDEQQCNSPCAGDSSLRCGGADKLHIWSNNLGNKPSTSVYVPPGYYYLGCYVEPEPGKAQALDADQISNGDVNADYCASYCSQYGFFGLERSNQCYCDNYLNTYSYRAENQGDCNWGCANSRDGRDKCGNDRRLNLYSKTVKNPPAGYAYMGCKTDSRNQRTLGDISTTVAGMSLQMCAKFCSNYAYFGVEYGAECYCGNSIASSGQNATNQNDCYFLCDGNHGQTCGAGDRIDVYSKLSTSQSDNNPTPSPAPPAGYQHLGCYSDSSSARGLNGPSLQHGKMTIQACQAFCSSYTYFSVEYSTECYCGQTLASSSSLSSLSDCSMPCVGNKAQSCGGSNRMNVYARTNIAPPGYKYLGCYTDSTSQRGLNAKSTSDEYMTIEKCRAFCSSYAAFSLEYARECYCGDTLATSSSMASDQSSCNMPCNGNGRQTCGGGNRMSTYSRMQITGPTGSTYLGCYTEATAERALTSNYTGKNTITIDSCQQFCTGYVYFGLENGRDCYCGNSLRPGSTKAQENDCYLPCAGNGAQICGASQRLSLFSQTTKPNTPKNGPGVPTISGFKYLGCFTQGTFEYALSDDSTTDYSFMTVEMCRDFCSDYLMFALGDGYQCLCGNSLKEGSVIANKDDCYSPCRGNKNQICGSPSRIGLYDRVNITTVTARPRTVPWPTPNVNSRTIAPFISAAFRCDVASNSGLCQQCQASYDTFLASSQPASTEYSFDASVRPDCNTAWFTGTQALNQPFATQSYCLPLTPIAYVYDGPITSRSYYDPSTHYTSYAKSPCCGPCTVNGNNVDVVYFDPGNPALSTLETEGTTLTSPTVYLKFSTLFAHNQCSQVGVGHENQFIPIPNGVLQTIDLSRVLCDGIETLRAFPYNVRSVLSISSVCDNVDWDRIPYHDYAYYEKGVYRTSPYSAAPQGKMIGRHLRIRQAAACTQSLAGFDQLWQQCHPQIVIPPQAIAIDPAWGSCILGDLGLALDTNHVVTKAAPGKTVGHKRSILTMLPEITTQRDVIVTEAHVAIPRGTPTLLPRTVDENRH